MAMALLVFGGECCYRFRSWIFVKFLEICRCSFIRPKKKLEKALSKE